MVLVEDHHVVQAFTPNRPDDALDIRIPIRRRLQLIRTVRKNVSGLRIHSIRMPAASSP